MPSLFPVNLLLTYLSTSDSLSLLAIVLVIMSTFQTSMVAAECFSVETTLLKAFDLMSSTVCLSNFLDLEHSINVMVITALWSTK